MTPKRSVKHLLTPTLIIVALTLATTPDAEAYRVGGCRWSAMQVLNLTYSTGNLSSTMAEEARFSVLSWQLIAPQINIIQVQSLDDRGSVIRFSNTSLPEGVYGVAVTNMGAVCRDAKILIDEKKFSDLSWQQRRQILSHEFGHALGIDHSDRKDSIMTSEVNPWLEFGRFTAGRDEFYALQFLYGPVGDGNIWGADNHGV